MATAASSMPGVTLERIPTLDEIPGQLIPDAARLAPTGELATRTVVGWRDIMNQSYGELDFASLDKHRFAAGLRSTRLRDLSMHSIRATELVASRTREQASRTREDLTVMIWQTSGRSIAHQSEQRTILDAGDVAFLDFSTPYTVECVTPYTQIVMMVPTRQLTRRVSLVGRHEPLRAAKLVDPGLASPWLALLRELCRQTLGGAVAVPSFYQSAIDAIGNLAALTSPQLPTMASTTREGNRLRVLDFIDEHCDDPELNIDAIARGVAMSRRTLFRVFHDAELGVEDHLLRARLDRALALLEISASDYTVDSIARLAGFRSTSHFHARFLEQHGRTPAQYRAEFARAA